MWGWGKMATRNSGLERDPHVTIGNVDILHGDCREVLASMAAESVHCIVTSPPYW